MLGFRTLPVGGAVFTICCMFGCGSTPETPALPPVPPGKYRVQDGDMLSKIAQRRYGDGNLWYVLLNANPDLKSRPNFSLYAGEIISVPEKDKIDRGLPKSEFPENLPGTYVILPGDSLRFIAKVCYGDPDLWKAIYAANKDILPVGASDNPRNLNAGQAITIPAKPR